MSTSTLDDLRRRNLARLVSLLHSRGALSRSALAAEMGLNRSTVGVLVSELVDVGIAVETAGVGSGVGRPSLMVAPVPSAAAVLAYDLRVDRTVAALVGVGGDVLARMERRNRRGTFTPRSAVRLLTEMADDLLSTAPADCAWIGTGVGVPGLVGHGGEVVLAPNLGWTHVELGAMLAESLGASSPRLVVRNDADAGVVAERIRGSARGVDNAVYLSGEVGIGGGVILNGRLLSGAGGFGGEVGHMAVNPSGLDCRCGARGCWETEIGRDAVMAAIGLDPAEADIPDLVALAAADPGARAGLEVVGDWIGVGLANLVNLFNPDLIILGGHLRRVHEAVAPAMESRLRRALPAARDAVRLTYPQLGASSTLIGMSEAAFESLLDDPLGCLSSRSVAS